MREEALAELLRESIRRVSIPDEWADKMLAEVETWKQDEEAQQADLAAPQKTELDQTQERLDRLLDAYIEGILDKDEFAARKEKCVHRKAELADSVARIESGEASRLEPLVTFITDSRQARYEAESENLADLRKWHHLVGSNLLFASEVIESEGVSMSETVTAHGVRVGEKSQQPDGASVRSKDGSRGGSAARSLVSNHQNHPENGTFSAVAVQSQGEQSAFIPILPADVSAGDSAFRFLGSKTDPILHVSYPSSWNLVAHFAAKRGEISENSLWRRGRDSNPRCLAARRFSRPVHSTTLPPLQMCLFPLCFSRLRYPCSSSANAECRHVVDCAITLNRLSTFGNSMS